MAVAPAFRVTLAVVVAAGAALPFTVCTLSNNICAPATSSFPRARAPPSCATPTQASECRYTKVSRAYGVGVLHVFGFIYNWSFLIVFGSRIWTDFSDFLSTILEMFHLRSSYEGGKFTVII